MQKQRDVHGWTSKQAAQAFRCSPAHISRVEQGKNAPSRSLVIFYDEMFGADGLLLSLYEATVEAGEQARRRGRGWRSRVLNLTPSDDASAFVGDAVRNGAQKQPGEVFLKSWQLLNSGSVAWIGRSLERQGPKTGPGLITSPAAIPIPQTQPGELVTIPSLLKAPTYDCTAIAYFKMINADGQLCFPNNYQLGLEVIVTVVGQLPDQVLDTATG